MLPIKERFNNPRIVRVYRQRIEKAPDHAKTKLLEEFFVKRLGA